MLTFAMVSASPNSPAICSRAGAICLQGPHHSAQKSTRTGLEAWRTSASNDASVTATVFMAWLLAIVQRELSVLLGRATPPGNPKSWTDRRFSGHAERRVAVVIECVHRQSLLAPLKAR